MQGPVWALPGQLRGAAAVGCRPAFPAPVRIHTTALAFAGLGFGVCIFVFIFFSEGGKGNIHIAFIFNTFADAFENVYATEFANIL